MLLGALLLGKITRNRRSAYDFAGFIANRGDRDGDIQVTTIFGDADGLIMSDVLTLANARKNLWNLVRAIGGRQKGNILSNDLTGAVPVHFLGAPVPGSDGP